MVALGLLRTILDERQMLAQYCKSTAAVASLMFWRETEKRQVQIQNCYIIVVEIMWQILLLAPLDFSGRSVTAGLFEMVKSSLSPNFFLPHCGLLLPHLDLCRPSTGLNRGAGSRGVLPAATVLLEAVLPLDHIFHGRALTGTGLLWMVGNGSGRRRRGQLRVATQLTGRDLDERKEALRWEVREWEWRADKQRQQVAELMRQFGG
jgi:hypothetical protein